MWPIRKISIQENIETGQIYLIGETQHGAFPILIFSCRDAFHEFAEIVQLAMEGMQTKEYIVSKNDKDLLTFQLRPISFGGVDVLVGDIRVTSPEFKTKEGIGVDSTVSDFIKAYPNYRFWYSQEEGEHFVINTSSDKENLQFFLDRSGLLNPDKSFYPTRATISDFKTDAKIVSVRVY